MRYSLRAKLKDLRPLQNFHEPWAWQKLWRSGLYARGSIVQGSIESWRINQADGVMDSLTNLRSRIRDQVRSITESMARQRSFLALFLGVRSELDESQWDVLRRSGLTHLLVISGLHIGLIAMLVMFTLRWMFCWLPRQFADWIACGLTILTILSYVALIDYGLPALRASLAVSFALLMLRLRRRILPSTFFIAVLSCSLLLDPLAPWSAGFWLSFVAVGLLFAAFSHRPLQSFSKWGALWRSQMVLTIGLAGFLAISFQQIPSSAPLANLIATPLITLIVVPLGLLALVVGLVWPSGGEVLLRMTDVCLDGFWRVAEMASLGPILQAPLEATLASVGFIFVGICTAAAMRAPGAVWFVGLLALLGMGMREQDEPVWFRYTLLDVGQGLASVIESRGETVLYDAGPGFVDGWSAGEAVVGPYLRSVGVEGLKYAVISHGDSDHAGGWDAVRSTFAVASALSGEPERVAGTSLCVAGADYWVGAAKMEVLWPLKEVSGKSNNRSCVIRLTVGELGILMTGDIEASAQRALLTEAKSKLASDIMVSPHHGSASSFLPEFASAVSPRVVIASAGYLNPFGHPHKLVRDWFVRRDAIFYNTAQVGAVQVSIEEAGGAIKIQFGGPLDEVWMTLDKNR
ncbi:DNA internalization-related competence protein ComEC/Rec2 [Hahella chejuensis]|nr:DNA internalization-related competence protein ComEC/Rec2 [Hahella chejuensis]